MKKELHLNNLTHIEKLDLFIDRIKKIKNDFRNKTLNPEAKKALKGIDLMVMMHDYEAYVDASGYEGNSTKNPYIKKLKSLYYEIEKENSYYKNKWFKRNIELKKETEVMIDSLHFKFGIIKLFKMSNQRIFKISSKLIDLIDITDYNNDISHIRTPYDCIYMKFPADFGKERSWGHREDIRRVEGAYISIYEGLMRYVLVPKSKLDLKDNYNARLILTECLPSELDLTKRITIKEIINNYKKASEGRNYSFGEMDEYILTTIIKLLMHITSINVKTEKVTPNINIQTNKKKLSKKNKTALPYEYVGGDININKSNNFVNNSGNGTGKQITTKFMVRGHYRGFWMNLNNDIPNHQIIDIKDDKMLVSKWVEPYWKGSEFAEVVLKDYNVS